MVDEHPDADQVITLYDRHAKAWARDRGDRLIERAWLDRFVACLPDQCRTVLDVGCGTAVPIGQYLINQGCRLHGVDSSGEMITMTRTRFPDHRWDVADMRSLALDGRYGGIIAWDSLFHLSPHHQRSLFPIIARHAASGAALMFNTAHQPANRSATTEANRSTTPASTRLNTVLCSPTTASRSSPTPSKTRRAGSAPSGSPGPRSPARSDAPFSGRIGRN
ncbi:methyltransferase domain-containing protein [Mycolicibacterium neoaurum]|uniref:class I SAM-dependent DNA methyltransferase n=1 Tax=Mycolicibacterium neoaurum TaxID=1795 RepID=UPI002671AA6F|nr:class I SAM-dependent methyltransferase [Mycolicibacterium neoaurum]MDO3401705.1 methyltransferase domain-containing protein [Mycolicibacterium neoaurum]